MKIHVISAGRNHHAFAEWSIRSVLEQHIPDGVELAYTWIDDASEPRSAWPSTMKAVTLLPGTRVVRNTYRRGALANVYDACMLAVASDSDVIVHLGGDDYLLPGAIEKVAKMFSDPECWASYGSYVASDPTHVMRAGPMQHADFRNHPFVWMPFCWRAALTPKIREEDLKIGGFWQMGSGDTALYLPILEMAGIDRLRYCLDPLVQYNIHPGNDSSVDKRLQDFCHWVSYQRPRYKRLASLSDPAELEPDTRGSHNQALIFLPHTEHPQFWKTGVSAPVTIRPNGWVDMEDDK